MIQHDENNWIYWSRPNGSSYDLRNTPFKIIFSKNINGYCSYGKNIAPIKQKYQIQTTLDNKEVAKFADILILAVNPSIHSDVIKEIKDVVKLDTLSSQLLRE